MFIEDRESVYKKFYTAIGGIKEQLQRKRRLHTQTCPAEDLTGHAAPCRCGADEVNAVIEYTLAALDRI